MRKQAEDTIREILKEKQIEHEEEL